MKIKTIIVEDEPASQDILKQYISDTPQLDLVAICANALEANQVLCSENIQLIFLDINMPVISGLDFYKTLKNPPLAVFTTAYPEYALEGFEVAASDYLVKPISFERYLKAVNKVSDQLKLMQNQPTLPDFILLHADKRIHKVNLHDIYYLEVMGDYVKVYLQDKPLIVHDTLQNMEQQLPPAHFLRVHRSFIISLEKIGYLEGNMVKVRDKLIPVSDTYRKNLMERIKGRRDV